MNVPIDNMMAIITLIISQLLMYTFGQNLKPPKHDWLIYVSILLIQISSEVDLYKYRWSWISKVLYITFSLIKCILETKSTSFLQWVMDMMCFLTVLEDVHFLYGKSCYTFIQQEIWTLEIVTFLCVHSFKYSCFHS